jgi:hypothetical protein
MDQAGGRNHRPGAALFNALNVANLSGDAAP